jgi:DNA-binding PadR family transcriptional regulator
MVGNIPNFTDIDLLRCFMSIGQNTSRLCLVKKLELGEGTIRTMLDILKSKGLIESTKKGHSLSKKGANIMRKIKKEVEVLNKPSYKAHKNLKISGIVVKNHGRIEKTAQLRDSAIKNGAEAALVLVFDKKLKIPDFRCSEDFSELENCYKFRNRDVLIATFASSAKLAERGSLSIAIELSKCLKKFIKALSNS